MLQQEVKKALQEGRPVPPEGFDERSTAQVLHLTSEVKTGRKIPRAVVVLCTVLMVLGIATALAATVESINERLYSYWPELADFLMPVHADCESSGIRMEVESAVVKDDTVIITYSLQDLEGDRLNEFTQAQFDWTAFPLNDTSVLSTDSSSVLLSHDPEARKSVYVQEIKYGQSVRQGEYDISLRIPSLTLKQVEVADLHSLLGQYGENPAAMPASRAYIRYATGIGEDVPQVPDTLKILDYSQNPEIRIQEHAAISGIGWIDGLLHVQIHYIGNDLVRTGDGSEGYYPVTAHVLMQLADGWSPCYKYSEKLPGGVHFIAIGGDEDRPEWEEYIFPCDPSEVSEGRLEAEITRNETVEALYGDWCVKVPLRMIRYE